MITYLANPARFMKFARPASVIFMVIFLISLPLALWQGLLASPADVKHGEAVRIMYVHVPAAIMCMGAYVALFIASFVSFVWRHNLADYGAKAFARIGIVFTALCLITGSIWGKTGWGTWWEWDGRMTSVLVLFFIYLAYLFIWQIVEDKKRASRLAAIFAMVGLINIPIIKFSVEWWASLHQPASILTLGGKGLEPEHEFPLVLMIIVYMSLFAWLSIEMVKTDINRAQANRKSAPEGAKIVIEDL